VSRPSPTSTSTSDDENTPPSTRNSKSVVPLTPTHPYRLVGVERGGLFIPRNSFRTSKCPWSNSKSMVRCGREKIIPSIWPPCRLQMLDPIVISSSLQSATRMNPLHHPIQGGMWPIHLDDNLWLGPRGRLLPVRHSRHLRQPGLEYGQRMCMMSRIYLLIERVQDLRCPCVRRQRTRLRLLHPDDRLPHLQSLVHRFLDNLYLEPVLPILLLPIVLDLPYPEHHIRRTLRRFTVSVDCSRATRSPRLHRYTSTTQPPRLYWPFRSPNHLCSTTRSSPISRFLVLSQQS